MAESLRVKRSELARDVERVLDAVHCGETAVVEHDGQAEAAILDIVDYHLLRSFVCYHARPGEHDLSLEPTDTRFAGLDECGRYDLVMAYYLHEGVSLGRVAELLSLPWIEVRDRFHRLGIPLRLGPTTLEELEQDVENARVWSARG
jgi:hypothetical protein